jgi:hypothetical protein
MTDTPPPSDPETAERHDIATLVSAIDVAAPAALRRRVREMTDAAPRSRRVAGRPLALAGALAGAAVAVVVLILALSGGSSGSAPTVQQASALAQRPATQGAPAESSVPGRLAISAAGIPYPYWGQRFGWQAVGARTDSVGGHMVTTVFYARVGTSSTAGSSTGRSPSGASGVTPSTGAPTQRIAYSIVAGAPLAVPTAGHPVVSRGTSYRVLASGTDAVVTWRRAGHTCILVGSGVSSHTLLTLARWQAT